MLSKPVIIFGTGRSGTTVLHRVLSSHPEFAWMSGLCDRHPGAPQYNRSLMHALDFPVLGDFLKRKFPADEGYRFWDRCYRGFSTPCRDLLASDVTVRAKEDILKPMSKRITNRRARLLLKVTGWPRTGFLSEVFEGAKFIHVVRDGRAVVNSLLNVDFWRGWGGPEKWRWGPLPPAYAEEWRRHSQSFVVLAAIQWKILMDAAEKAKQLLDSTRIMEIKYEDICREPENSLKAIAGFCEVQWSDEYAARVRRFRFTSANDKYRNELTLQQQAELEDGLRPCLARCGYS